MTHKIIVFIALSAVALLVWANYEDGAIYHDASGRALAGMDAVSYHSNSGPVPGQATHEISWNGVNWWFASAENRAEFRSEPHRYAPDFGGFSVSGVSSGLKIRPDPMSWLIVDGHLLLFASGASRDAFVADETGHLSLAYQNWPSIADRSPKGH